MKKFVLLIIITLCSVTIGNAQSYTDHLQQKVQGQGKVTVTQSKQIDDLVNGKANTQHQQQSSSTKTRKNAEPKQAEREGHVTATTPSKHEHEVAKQEEANREETAARHKGNATARKNDDKTDDEMEIPTVDMRKKVMRRSHKVNGYRVQAFAGGNSRADRQKAERIGAAIKLKFPNQPIYVHFYSPRWICRVGNYRSYQQANWMLKEVKKMGYRSAVIVKGKITVQY